MDCFIGVDVGTSSTKSLILQADGRIIGSAQVKYNVLRPYTGFAEQDIEVLWDAAKDTLKELCRKYPEAVRNVKCIGYSGQMHGLVMLDAENRPLRNAIIWEDQRSVREIDDILSVVPYQEFCGTTLNTLSTGFLVSSLVWVRKNEAESFNRMRKLIMIKDYVRYRMCGEIACETTDAASSAIFDVAERTWAWDIIDQLGLPRDVFPPCHEPYELAGTLLDSVAEEIGLPKGVPLVYGGGDTLMHLVGTGTIDELRPWVANIGTSCQVTCGMNRPNYDPQFRTNTFCHAKKDLWMLMACNLCGGAAMKWLTDMVFQGLSFTDLNQLAEQVRPGSDGLIFLPYLSGSRLPENNARARAMFMGMTLTHSRNHMIRATMEGVVYSQKLAYNVLSAVTKREPECVIASGGGARGELFLQMQADMYNKPIRTTVEAEQSCIGAAITAAVGVGYFKSYAEGCDAIVRFNDRIIEPVRENVDRYNDYFEIYRELYPRNKDLFDKYHS